VGNLGGFCSGEAGPGTVFDRLGFPRPLPDADPPIEARTEPEARTETDAPSSIRVSIARSKAPTDFCVAIDALLLRTEPAKDVAAEREDIADRNDVADV
jgi:hypothetical protein